MVQRRCYDDHPLRTTCFHQTYQRRNTPNPRSLSLLSAIAWMKRPGAFAPIYGATNASLELTGIDSAIPCEPPYKSSVAWPPMALRFRRRCWLIRPWGVLKLVEMRPHCLGPGGNWVGLDRCIRAEETALNPKHDASSRCTTSSTTAEPPLHTAHFIDDLHRNLHGCHISDADVEEGVLTACLDAFGMNSIQEL